MSDWRPGDAATITPTHRRQGGCAESWDGLPIVTACRTVRRFGGLAHCLARQGRATVWAAPWQTVAPLRPIYKVSRLQSRSDSHLGRVRLALLRMIRSCNQARWPPGGLRMIPIITNRPSYAPSRILRMILIISSTSVPLYKPKGANNQPPYKPTPRKSPTPFKPPPCESPVPFKPTGRRSSTQNHRRKNLIELCCCSFFSNINEVEFSFVFTDSAFSHHAIIKDSFLQAIDKINARLWRVGQT